MKIIAHRGSTEFLVGAAEPTEPLATQLVRIVDTARGSASIPLKMGSIVAQASPDDWQGGRGDADDETVEKALQLAKG